MRFFSLPHSSPSILTLLVACILPGTDGFFPSDFREKYFGNGGVSHEFQTRKAYDTLAAKYFPDITTNTANMNKARTAWAEANMEVDKDQKSSAKHFDGENFAGGNAILVQAKINVTNALRNGNGKDARQYLGAALHTVQDFYAHTNWVELGNPTINTDLGKAGAVLSTVTFADRTCNECAFGGLQRLLTGCHDCTSNTNGFTKLTSGYYFGEDSPAGGVPIPDHKCHHGGATDTDSILGAAGGIAEAIQFKDVPQGINKDSLNCFWSPHHYLHSKAAEYAILSSIQYIEDLVAENSLTIKEKKILFGVGTTLAFAIDTTGSMAGIIAATQAQAIDIAQKRIGTKDEPIDYVVSPFNDPTTGPVFKTTDFDAFRSDINSLSAFGGGDCPELALAGIIAALDVMEGPAELFVMTDAFAKDADRVPEAISIATQKRISFHVFKFDSGCDDGIPSKRDGLSRRVDSGSNRIYSLLAAATGGSYHSLPTSEAGTISSLLDSLTLSESNAVFKISGTLNATSSFELPVDSKMTEFSISLRGAGVTIVIKKPDGSTLDKTSSGVTVNTVTDGEFWTVKSPVSGVWTLTLEISGSIPAAVSCDVSGVSPLHLSSFNFVTLAGRAGHRGYYPIEGQPAYDHDVAAVAVIDGAFASATFDLRDTLGSHAVDPHMEAGSGAEGAPPKNSFYGEMRLIPGQLYAYVKGTDDAGTPFQRVLATVFQPLLSNTTETGFNSTDIFAGTNNTNITTSSPSPTPSSTPITLPSGYANSSSVPYPTHSAPGHGYNSSYPMPTYPWDHATYVPTPTGSITTHHPYVTPGCDSLVLSTYKTTSTCTISDKGSAPYKTVTTTTVTTYVPVLCSTCTGANYPHHTGKGPWFDKDKSVIESGYGTCVSTVPFTSATGYGTTPTTTTVSKDKAYTATTKDTAYPTTIKGSTYPPTSQGSVYPVPGSSNKPYPDTAATPIAHSEPTSAIIYATHPGASTIAAPPASSNKPETVNYVSASTYKAAPGPDTYVAPPSPGSKATEKPASLPAPSNPPAAYTSVPVAPVAPANPPAAYTPAPAAPVAPSYPASNGTSNVTGVATGTAYPPAQFTGAAARVGVAFASVLLVGAFWVVGLM